VEPEPFRRPNFQRIVSSVHGNGVFSDCKESAHIDHTSEGSIVSRESGEEAKIHFILPTLPAPSTSPRPPIYGVRPNGRVEEIEESPEDISPEEQIVLPNGLFGIGIVKIDVDSMSSHSGGTPSVIKRVEIYLGKTLYWSSGDIQEMSSFTLPVKRPITALSQSDRGIGVTVTIEFGSTEFLFSSVALVGTSLLRPLGPPRP